MLGRVLAPWSVVTREPGSKPVRVVFHFLFLIWYIRKYSPFRILCNITLCTNYSFQVWPAEHTLLISKRVPCFIMLLESKWRVALQLTFKYGILCNIFIWNIILSFPLYTEAILLTILVYAHLVSWSLLVLHLNLAPSGSY